MTSNNQRQSVLVLTPTGRDAQLVCRSLIQAGLSCDTCASVQDLVKGMDGEVGTAVIAEESLTPDGSFVLRTWLAGQPPWSDFPLVVLTNGGSSTHSSLASFNYLKTLGNVTLLERPVRTVTLLSAVEAALRARARQYEAQAYITERLEAEEALARQAAELARSNADLQQFAYVTSHDLQEPLRTIHAYAQLLGRHYPAGRDAEIDEFLGYIIDGAKRMQALIQDLLAYSKVVNLEARPLVPVPMGSVLHWALENLQLAIADTGARVSQTELPEVVGDHVQLVQLLQNLLSNAIKYRRPEVPPVISVSASADGEGWRFCVADEGLGIAPSYHERIFGVFKRLHGREIPGTGIGLAICRKIVEKHGGTLWVESEAGQGARFYFTLPGREAVDAGAAQSA